MEAIFQAPDKFQRYWLAATLCQPIFENQPCPKILDLGAHEGLIDTFLPGGWKVQADINSDFQDLAGTCVDARNLPFKSDEFHIVFALDILEHIPNGDRDEVLDEIFRVSRDLVIISFPIKSDTNSRSESFIMKLDQHVFDRVDLFLEEHSLYGLPDPDPIRKKFQMHFPHVVSLPVSGHPIWLIGQLLDRLFSLLPNSQMVANTIHALMNQVFHQTHTESIPYRMILGGSRMEIPETPGVPKISNEDGLLTR